MDKKTQQRLIAIAGLLVVVGISVCIFLFRDRIPEFQKLGYLGVFLISLATNATVVLPAGNFLVVSIFGAALSFPLLVGLAAGAGATLGELTGYMAGYSGQAMVEKSELYNRLFCWMRRWGTVTIFVLSLAPLFFDLAGIAAGALRFPLWRFLLVCWLGRSLLYVGIAFGGAWGLKTLLPFLG